MSGVQNHSCASHRAEPLKSYSLSSPSLSSVTDWQFTFAYHMFGSSMGELFLQGWSHDSWATLWQISGDHGAAWHEVNVNIPSLASQLRFVADTSLGDIALDAFESLGFRCSNAIFNFPSGHVLGDTDYFSMLNIDHLPLNVLRALHASGHESRNLVDTPLCPACTLSEMSWEKN